MNNITISIDTIAQLVVEQNVHSVHCVTFYIRIIKKLNKYYFKVPGLHTQPCLFPKILLLQQPPNISTMRAKT